MGPQKIFDAIPRAGASIKLLTRRCSFVYGRRGESVSTASSRNAHSLGASSIP